MDLLIELIVWIVKALAGEDTKSTPTAKPGGAPRQRGPYNYGDGRPAAGRPKTLEEILEEVKRQQGQPRAAANAPRAAQPPAPVARAKVPAPLSRPLSEVQQPTGTPGGAMKSRIETRMITQSLDDRELVKPGLEKKFEKLIEREDQMARGIGHTKMVAEINTVNTMGEVETVTTMETGLANKKINTYADLFKAMRTAPGKARMEMARRAIVFNEVFGLPRSQRPHVRR